MLWRSGSFVRGAGGDAGWFGDAVFGGPGSGGEVFLAGVPETRTLNCRLCANWRTGYPVLPLWQKGVMLGSVNVTLRPALLRKRCSVLAEWRAVFSGWRAIGLGWRAICRKWRAVLMVWRAVLLKRHAFFGKGGAVWLERRAVFSGWRAFFWFWGAVFGREFALILAWPAFCGGGWGFPAPGAACLPLQLNLEVRDGAF